ncbi:LysR substrate-binding domain-containing protein [Paraburkholderia kirstenboschensis]|uniref:LysR substrate-binding domain-containing protein n=1 Tax=Paraburkholderia kirstenboschensis TaxID=1245436 RepID=UPI001FB4CCB5|nr:LysR substrate-binding domain-containing protein [Paraburkholderia kirstenboschensis]
MLTVTCLPTYAVKCLIPALPEFQRAHPDITVHLATSSTFNEFDRNSYDVAIRYGSGRWASARSDRLHGEEFFPVCSPAVLAEAGKFESVGEALSRMRQIRTYFYSMYQDDWPAWLEAAVHEPVEFAGESVFHLQLTSLAAAVDGVGIAIGRTPLVNGDLASGKLVAPFDVRVPSNSAYFVSSPTDKARTKSRSVSRVGARAARRKPESESPQRRGAIRGDLAFRARALLSSCPALISPPTIRLFAASLPCSTSTAGQRLINPQSSMWNSG